MTGRPSTLTPELAGAIVRLVRAGNHVSVACQVAGVPRSTYYAWLTRGDPDGTDPAEAGYRQFREAVERARAEAEASLVVSVARTGRTDSIEAACEALETLYPERWVLPRRRRSRDPFLDEDPPVPLDVA